MTTAISNPGLGAASPDGGGSGGGAVQILPVPPDLHLAAAARLIGDQAGDPLLAAQRFLDSASHLRVDLSLMWCTLDPHAKSDLGVGTAPKIRQTCLAVIGSGRTAMLFVSGPERKGRWPGAVRFRQTSAGSPEAALRERVALIHHACAAVALPGPDGEPRAVLAQSLIESRETEAAAALRAAGFMQLGDLAYMRRALPKSGPGRALEQANHLTLTDGLRLQTLDELTREGHSPEQIDAWLIQALDRSYEGTQDCPELCGLRAMSDVLDSHKSVGVFDPSLWWMLFDHNGPQGCMLLTICPEQDSVELVYLGLAAAVRGRNLGAQLLAFGLRRLYDFALGPNSSPVHPHIHGSGGVTCAVDTRNAPAMKLYKRAGFERFGLRVPLVRSLVPPRS